MFWRVRDSRRVAWFVVALALLVLALVAPLGSATVPFDRVLVFIGFFLSLGLALFPPRVPETRTPASLADALTREVLAREGRVLNNLLNAGHDPGRDALLVFYDSEGIRGDLPRVAEFYLAHTIGRLVVLGAPGAGKTVLLLRLICDLAKARDALDEQERSHTPVPLRFDLAGWDTSLELEDWLSRTIAARFTKLTRDQATTLLESGLVLPFLDGLDEMDNAPNKPRRAQEAVKHINRYMSGTDLKPVVLACREEEYRQLDIQIAEARTAQIVPLPRAEVDRFVREELKRDLDPGPLREWEDSIPATLFNGFWEAVSTPWVLTLLVVYLRDGGRMDDLLTQPAGSSAESYGERILSTLLARYLPARVRAADHASYSAARVQRWTAGLARNLGDGVDIHLDDVWRIGGTARVRTLHTLIALLITVGCFVGPSWDAGYLIERIRSSFDSFSTIPRAWIVWSVIGVLLAGMTAAQAAVSSHPTTLFRPLILTNLRTAKGRKSLLEELAGWLVSALMFSLAFTFAYGLVTGFAYGLVSGLTFGLAYGLVAGLVGCMAYGLGGWLFGGLAVSLAHRVRIGFVVGVLSGLTAGLGMVLTTWYLGEFHVWLVRAIMFGLLTGLISGLWAGRMFARTNDDLNEVPPAARVRSDRMVWLALGVAGGLAVGLVSGLSAGISPGWLVMGGGAGIAIGFEIGFAGFMDGVTLWLAVGLAVGVGAVWMRYIVGIVVSASQGDLPLRLVPFLEWCVREGVLRRSGPAYQFRHISLRNHLVRTGPMNTP